MHARQATAHHVKEKSNSIHLQPSTYPNPPNLTIIKQTWFPVSTLPSYFPSPTPPCNRNCNWATNSSNAANSKIVSCEVCNDTIKKPKLDAHKGKCRGAYFTCLDCNTTFNGGEYKSHTVCPLSSSLLLTSFPPSPSSTLLDKRMVKSDWLTDITHN